MKLKGKWVLKGGQWNEYMGTTKEKEDESVHDQEWKNVSEEKKNVIEYSVNKLFSILNRISQFNIIK